MRVKKILVTGVGGYWGNRVAEKLAGYPEFQVLGLDTVAPKEPVPGLDFIQADIRNPLLAELLKAESVDVVYHLAFKESTRPSESTFDYNVMGTMKVFGACSEASVQKIIIRSSTAAYGAQPMNPAFLTEQHAIQGSRSSGTTRDLVEIEAFCNGFLRQSPQIQLVVLRFANVIGPTIDSPMMRYMNAPVSTSLMGFDPMMQCIHEEDAIEALVHAGLGTYSGVFNIAAEDFMPLSKILGIIGQPRLPVFHPLAYWGYETVGYRGLRLLGYIPYELDYIRYRWVGDLQRMREVLNFLPAHTAEEALHQIAEQRHSKRTLSDTIARAYDNDRLREIIKRRQVSDLATDEKEGLEAEDHE